MANQLLHKYSATSGVVPTSAELPLRQIALNTADGKLFIKKVDGTILTFESAGAFARAVHSHVISDVTGLQRELAIDASTGSLWTKLKTGIVRKILAIAAPHASTHAAGQPDAITPVSIGAALIDHQHTPLDLVGVGDIVTYNSSDFAPASHTHGVGQVAGLSAQLDALAQRISALEQQVHPQ